MVICDIVWLVLSIAYTSSMHHELKQKAIELRMSRHLSYSAILAQIPVAKSTLSEWLKNYPLSKDRILELKRLAWKKNEIKIELFRETMRAKREEKDKKIYTEYLFKFRRVSEKSLFFSGLMLYLAEGSKTDKYTLKVTNTDPRVCRFFIFWLEKFYNTPKEKIRAQLQLYPTMDVEGEARFWESELELKKSQFYKTFMRELRPASFSYKGSSRHGICSVIFSNTETKGRVMMAIKAYLDTILK